MRHESVKIRRYSRGAHPLCGVVRDFTRAAAVLCEFFGNRSDKMHFLLLYDVVDGYIEKRKPHRPDHFAHAQRAYDAGELRLAGALDEPVDGAVFVFRGNTAEAAKRFAENDPYVKNGLVTAWRVRKWTTVLGDGLQLPKL